MFFSQLKVLHIGPEKFFQEALRSMENLQYMSVDLNPRSAMVRMDVMKLGFPDDFFDVVLCVHVLTQVLDDRRALDELYRVLKPGGWTILQSPIDPDREATVEHSDVLTRAKREQSVGHVYHVRTYGRDYVRRLEEAGFSVVVDPYAETLGVYWEEKLGLPKKEKIFICSKAREKSEG